MSNCAVVWPEGLPERAVLCRSWLRKQWELLKPTNIFLMRRMSSAWPVLENESPVVVARRCERAMRKVSR